MYQLLIFPSSLIMPNAIIAIRSIAKKRDGTIGWVSVGILNAIVTHVQSMIGVRDTQKREILHDRYVTLF